MLNFNLHTTTEIVFGKDIEEQIGPRLKKLGAHRILVHFGRLERPYLRSARPCGKKPVCGGSCLC